MYTRGLDGEYLLKPPLKLIGAKTKVRGRLYPLFPEHTRYFEPFGGTAGVLIGKPKVERETLSDINPYVIAFYKVLRHDEGPRLFWEYLQIEVEHLNKVSDPALEFLKWKRLMVRTNDDVYRAVLFYLVTKHALNGILRFNKSGECNSTFCKTIKGRGILTKEWLDAVATRIHGAEFLEFDFDYVFRHWIRGIMNDSPSNAPSSFVFVDPPYRYKSIENGRGCVTVYNSEIFTDDKHQLLASWLIGAKFKWLLTINDDDWIRELYKDFEIVPHSIFYSCSQTSAGRSERPELLIANYPIREKFDDITARIRMGNSPRKRKVLKPAEV